jgi:glycine cleavage system aminomethyltransferase T
MIDKEVMPLGNEPVYAGVQLVGQVTSAAYGYRVGRPVALAYVDENIMSESKPRLTLRVNR